MIDVIIADDEQPARQRIRQLLDDFPNFSVVAEVNNGDELVTSVITHKPQVVFLDINMPGTSVFTSMESIKDPPLILFQTAYPQYALDAFGVDAIDYLVKPVSRERFARAIEKVTRILDGTRISSDSPATSPVDEVKKKQGYISVKDGGAIKVLDLETITLATSEDGITIIQTGESRYIYDQTLSELETTLPGNQFFRVSRSAIIRLSAIDTIHPFFNGTFKIQLHNGATVDVSRRRAKDLRQFVDF